MSTWFSPFLTRKEASPFLIKTQTSWTKLSADVERGPTKNSLDNGCMWQAIDMTLTLFQFLCSHRHTSMSFAILPSLATMHCLFKFTSSFRFMFYLLDTELSDNQDIVLGPLTRLAKPFSGSSHIILYFFRPIQSYASHLPILYSHSTRRLTGSCQ